MVFSDLLCTLLGDVDPDYPVLNIHVAERACARPILRVLGAVLCWVVCSR